MLFYNLNAVQRVMFSSIGGHPSGHGQAYNIISLLYGEESIPTHKKFEAVHCGIGLIEGLYQVVEQIALVSFGGVESAPNFDILLGMFAGGFTNKKEDVEIDRVYKSFFINVTEKGFRKVVMIDHQYVASPYYLARYVANRVCYYSGTRVLKTRVTKKRRKIP